MLKPATRFVLYFQIRLNQKLIYFAERHLKFEGQKESAWKKYGIALKVVPTLKYSYLYIFVVPLIVSVSYYRKTNPLYVFLQHYCGMTPGFNANYILAYLVCLFVVTAGTLHAVSLFYIMIKCMAVSTFWLKFESNGIFEEYCECFGI